MKKSITILIFFAFAAIFTLIVAGLYAVGQDNIMNVQLSGSIPVESENPQIWVWLSDRWELVALFVSEVAAFLPSKANGIVHAVVRALSVIFRRKQ